MKQFVKRQDHPIKERRLVVVFSAMDAGHDVVARQIHFQCDDAPARFFKPKIEIIDPWKYREGNQNNDGGDESAF